MKVQVPEDRVYYYECSAGRFRLVSFIPRTDLEELVAAGKLDAKALRDFPDGLDLDCSEADFDEFERRYGYRPPHSADELRAAFMAIFSSTDGWSEFRGSGFIPASDLEPCVPEVAPILERQTAAYESEALALDLTARPERGQKARRRAAVRREMQTALEELEVEAVDPSKSLREQSFAKIKMSEGAPAPEFFAKVQRQRS